MKASTGGRGPPPEHGAGGVAPGPSGAVNTVRPAALSVGATVVHASPSVPAHSRAEVVKGLLLVKPETRTTASGDGGARHRLCGRRRRWQPCGRDRPGRHASRNRLEDATREP